MTNEPRAKAWVLLGLCIAGSIGILWQGFTYGSRLEAATAENALNRPLKVGIVSWPGYAGGIAANKGFRPNQNSVYWAKYHQQLEFVLAEDTDVRAKAFARGDFDIVWTTVDFWANELPGFLQGGVPAKVIMQVDWSRGGDAIVVDQSITRIEDLKGRRIALAWLTPSQWLLENALARSKLSEDEVAELMKTVAGKDSVGDARIDFVSGKVDAAVVWEPDITAALRERPGSHLLLTSKADGFDHLLADCMVAREDFITKNPEAIRAFVNGWLDGTQVANNDHPLVVRLLMENEPMYRDLGEEQTRAGLATVKWADLNDNIEMFGLDGRKAVFDKLFSEAGKLWQKRGIIKKAVAPGEAVDLRFLKEIYRSQRSYGRKLVTG